jgi:hypothetical protein
MLLGHWSEWLLQSYDSAVSLLLLIKKVLKMRKLVLFFAGFVLMASFVQAQQITGVIKDQQGKGLDKSTVSLLNAI